MTDIQRRGIGILGGTFDPVHTGHLALAKAAWESLPVARLNFLPAGIPWQKNGITAPEHRLAMLTGAVQALDRDEFGVDPVELHRPGATYTIDTVREYREKAEPSMPIVLVMGEDQWRNLCTWHDWEKLLDYCHFAVANRETALSAPKELEILLKCHRVEASELRLTPSGGIALFRMPAHRASSTEIRESLARLPLRSALARVGEFLPADVLTYILDHKLYGSSQEEV